MNQIKDCCNSIIIHLTTIHYISFFPKITVKYLIYNLNLLISLFRSLAMVESSFAADAIISMEANCSSFEAEIYGNPIFIII